MFRFRQRCLICTVLLAPVLLSACTSMQRRADAKLSDQLDQALGKGATGSAHYTARVVDLSTGKQLYAVDSDTPYMPASNGKLCVSAATLDFFGSSKVFKTYLAVDGKDLWLIGTGDPGTGDAAIAKKYKGTTMTILDDFADALKERGITRIEGNIYYYDRAFDDQWINPTWGKSYITDWYAAPISGLNFNNNCIDVSVKPTTEGQPVTYTVIPPTAGVKIDNECVTGKGDAPDVDRKRDADVFTVSGATTKPVDINSEAVINPGAFFADALKTHLQSRGITVVGDSRRAYRPLNGMPIPPSDKIVAVHETKLPDALKRINKDSQNNFAEAFCKMLGKAYEAKQGRDVAGSWPAGSDAVHAFLARNQIDASKLVVEDGSGLSRENRVTSHIISELLRTMWTHREKQTFFESLGISGEDGTIRKRMLDLKGRVHAKTGYIGGVRALSGYLQTDSGRWLAFSIIYNGIEGGVKPYEERQDNACRILAAWPKTITLPTSRPSAATTQSAEH